MANNNANREMNIIESFTTSIGKYVEELPLWKKELQMILISLYITLSGFVTLAEHIIYFHPEYPRKLVDILTMFAMFLIIIVNLGFIYGCYKKNRTLLFLTPAIPHLILIYVFFPKFHPFIFPLNELLKANGLQGSTLSKLINNIGSLSFIRYIYLVPIALYARFLFNNYTDKFIEYLQEVRKLEKEEAEAKKAKEETTEQQGKIEEITNEETQPEEINQDDENENADDLETKKNN